MVLTKSQTKPVRNQDSQPIAIVMTIPAWARLMGFLSKYITGLSRRTSTARHQAQPIPSTATNSSPWALSPSWSFYASSTNSQALKLFLITMPTPSFNLLSIRFLSTAFNQPSRSKRSKHSLLPCPRATLPNAQLFPLLNCHTRSTAVLRFIPIHGLNHLVFRDAMVQKFHTVNKSFMAKC